jgi:hypothetical protein
MDEWRPVAGFEGLYEVSRSGQIKRVGKAAKRGNGLGGGAVIGRIMIQRHRSNGYLNVSLSKEGAASNHLVHRIMALAFLPQPDKEQKFINHIDGNKLNNSLSNLEWVTFSENIIHSYRLGRTPHSGKLNKDQVLAIRASPERAKTLAPQYGVTQRSIHAIKAGTVWKYL